MSKRKEKLEAWSNRIARHPVLSHSFVFRHFLTCAEEPVSCLSVSLSSNLISLYPYKSCSYCDDMRLKDSLFMPQEWKAGKRRAEKDEFCGAQLLLTIEHPDVRTDLNRAYVDECLW